jgi:hypothetical protein
MMLKPVLTDVLEETKNDPAHGSRDHTLFDIPHIRFVFQITQEDLISSLMIAGYCRNM